MLTAIRDGQPEDVRGTAPEVPVLEGDDSPISINWASPVLFPYQNTSSGRFLGFGLRYDDRTTV
jgi:hypothetical protein